MAHHLLPLRVDIAILILFVTIASLVVFGVRARREARRRPSQIKVDLRSGTRDRL